jgi:enoyl-CoA hydratase/carnithine racemase
VFSFDVIRATTNAIDLADEVSAATAGVFTGDGSGNFSSTLTRTQLLGACPKGAFTEVLSVLPKATTGWNQRISAYDAYAVRSFALAPK